MDNLESQLGPSPPPFTHLHSKAPLLLFMLVIVVVVAVVVVVVVVEVVIRKWKSDLQDNSLFDSCYSD